MYLLHGLIATFIILAQLGQTFPSQRKEHLHRNFHRFLSHRPMRRGMFLFREGSSITDIRAPHERYDHYANC